MGPILCLVTDRRRLTAADRAEALISCVAAAARAGVHLVQVRENDLEGGTLVSLVARCVAAVRGTRARVVVNDRLDVALAAGAHGVHLPADGVAAHRVRLIVPAGFLIGRSIHRDDEAARAADEGAVDYLLFGTVFPTVSKPGRPSAGLDGLAAAAAAVRLPVLGIGGITAGDAADIAQTGAAGAAAIGMFADACNRGIDGVGEVVAEWTRRW